MSLVAELSLGHLDFTTAILRREKHRWGFIMVRMWVLKTPWEPAKVYIPVSEGQDAQTLTLWVTIFGPQVDCSIWYFVVFERAQKRCPRGWKCDFWSASASAFPDFCFSQLSPAILLNFSWGMKKLRKRSLNIYRNYSTSAAAAQDLLRLREQLSKHSSKA